MTIDGLSQTTGIERLLDVTAADAGVKLVIRDRKLGAEIAHVTVPTDGLMGVLTDQPVGTQAIAGMEGRVLEVEVRRNEVLLAIGVPDVAVGLDDLMDAVASSIPST